MNDETYYETYYILYKPHLTMFHESFIVGWTHYNIAKNSLFTELEKANTGLVLSVVLRR